MLLELRPPQPGDSSSPPPPQAQPAAASPVWQQPPPKRQTTIPGALWYAACALSSVPAVVPKFTPAGLRAWAEAVVQHAESHLEIPSPVRESPKPKKHKAERAARKTTVRVHNLATYAGSAECCGRRAG